MALLKVLLAVCFTVAAVALPPTVDLDTRQLLTAGATISCCDNCYAGYNYHELWHIFDDLCIWLGNGPSLWTNGFYYTQDYYCGRHWDKSICVRLQVEYHCGGDYQAPVSDDNPAGAMSMDYAGCMGYFTDAIQPHVCGGPRYPGAQIVSRNKCWAFKVVSEKSSFASSAIAIPVDSGDNMDDGGLDCAPDAKLCPIPTDSNGTALGGVDSIAVFGEPVSR